MLGFDFAMFCFCGLAGLLLNLTVRFDVDIPLPKWVNAMHAPSLIVSSLYGVSGLVWASVSGNWPYFVTCGLLLVALTRHVHLWRTVPVDPDRPDKRVTFSTPAHSSLYVSTVACALSLGGLAIGWL